MKHVRPLTLPRKAQYDDIIGIVNVILTILNIPSAILGALTAVQEFSKSPSPPAF